MTAPVLTSDRGVVVVEPRLPRRVRRPADLLRLVVVVALAGLMVGLATVAVGTTDGLEQDLLGAATGLPRFILSVVTLVAGVGTLALPVAIALDLLVRRRPWQLLDALVAATLAIVASLAIRWWVTTYQPGRLLEALTKVLPDGTRTAPVEGLLAGIVAFLTLSGLAGRALLRIAAVLAVGSVAAVSVLSGALTAVATVLSLLLGLAVGLTVRYAIGAAATRPPGTAVADALVSAGVDVLRLERVLDESVEPRRYLATRRDGSPVHVSVLDRDTYGSTLAYRVWRRLRLRGPATRRSFFTVRSAVDHAALMSLAVRSAGAPTPDLLAVAEVSPYAALVAHERVPGQSLAQAATAARTAAVELDTTGELDPVTAELTAEADDGLLDDARLAAAWRALNALQQRRIAHRGLTDDNLLLADDGGLLLLGVDAGEVAAGDLPLRLDIVQLLTTIALHTGPSRAVSSAAAGLGPQALVDALPLLQRIALGRPTRRALRHRKGLLHALRDRILQVAPTGEPVEEIQLERLRPRTVLAVVGASVAAYVLLTQLTRVDFAEVLSTADWRWAVVALAFSALTYVGASLTLMGFVLQKLSFVRTVMTQLAVSFSSLVAPTAVGTVALNTRFLERSGVDPAVALGSVGVAQVGMFVSYVVLLVLFGVLAGTGPQAAFTPPQGAIIAVLIVVTVALVVLGLPWGRRQLQRRVGPLLRRVVPRIVAVFQRPTKLLTGLGGALLLNAAYCFALLASTKAFGGELTIPAVAVVYLAGAVVGSAVPTPGGLGGVEAALAAGLTAAGMDSGLAVSAVLLYRLVTFWLPIPLGWASLTYLQQKGAI
ncbi:MAG: flippase-like domain-containing protein [Actinomycetia bacterium]|nr:flippase-like domain-containing protein [Actinomycetes bacterium]